MTEQEFRLRADQALEDLQHELLPLADEAGLEIDLRNGVLQILERLVRAQAEFLFGHLAPDRRSADAT